MVVGHGCVGEVGMEREIFHGMGRYLHIHMGMHVYFFWYVAQCP